MIGSSVHGILRARTLEWVAMPSSGDLPSPGMDPESLTSPALMGGFFTTSPTWEHLPKDELCAVANDAVEMSQYTDS